MDAISGNTKIIGFEILAVVAMVRNILWHIYSKQELWSERNSRR
jgi:hypothetical protein